jgi:hypothetical protein
MKTKNWNSYIIICRSRGSDARSLVSVNRNGTLTAGCRLADGVTKSLSTITNLTFFSGLCTPELRKGALPSGIPKGLLMFQNRADRLSEPLTND